MTAQAAGARPQARTLARVLEEKARLQPNHPAVIATDASLSYAELLEESATVARAMLAAGVKRGDFIGALLGNEARWIVVSMAAAFVGAAFVPLNTWYKKAELAWTLRHCNLRLVIAASDFLKTDYVALLEELVPELRRSSDAGELQSAAFPALRHVVFTGRHTPGAGHWDAFVKGADAISPMDFAAHAATVSPDQAAFVLYTSGSTADPKGVLLNHRGVVENGYDLGARRTIGPEDRVWIGTPLFYGLGATNALPATFTHGATVVLQGAFEAGAAIDTFHRTGATVYYGTGNMTRAILDHPDYTPAKIGSLKKGNAGTVAEYKRLTLVEMGITGAVPAYGLTETYGKPLPGMEMIIVDPKTGARLGSGEVGLVLIRGHTTPGYLNNPEETAKALRPDGFFDTGDLGSFDTDGRFLFHSRLKEVIKSGGINVSPLEVEQLLAGHPDVRDAFVVGVADPVKGELVVAFVDRSGDVSEADLRGYVKERAAAFKTPHHVLFRREADLPRLASGKVAKHRLAEEARRELGLETAS
jgi:fatty-acyl-CoA synthase